MLTRQNIKKKNLAVRLLTSQYRKPKLTQSQSFFKRAQRHAERYKRIMQIDIRMIGHWVGRIKYSALILKSFSLRHLSDTCMLLQGWFFLN